MNVEPYYIDLNRSLGEDFTEYEFDDQGIPLTRFHRKPDWQHNPITVSQYGLFHFNQYVNHENERSKDIFLNQANWLVDHAENGVNSSLVWRYRFDIPFYQITAPWISGMAQGEALSVLVRAHQLTHEEKFLHTAYNSWKILMLPIDQGGVVSSFPDKMPLVEEYPCMACPGTLTGVLNGFMFAIFGIYDYASYTGEPLAIQWFEKLIESLKSNLFRFDNGFWSYYDLKAPLRLSSKAYHRLHVEQLNQLYKITGEDEFKTYSDRWRSYLFSLKCKLKWTIRKIHQKIFINTTSFI